MLTSVLDGGKL